MRSDRLHDEQVREIREDAAAGANILDLAARYRVGPCSIAMLLRGDSYVDAGGPIRPARRRYRPDIEPEEFIRVGRQLVLDNVEVTPDGCWLWKGTTHSVRGYFNVKLGAKSYLAHRLSYLAFKGELDPDLEVGHLCHDRSDCEAGDACQHRRCCRPDHLRAMTHEENIRAGRGDWRGRMTQCQRGHAFDTSNTAWRQRSRGGWQRLCKACAQERASRDAKKRSHARAGDGNTSASFASGT